MKFSPTCIIGRSINILTNYSKLIRFNLHLIKFSKIIFKVHNDNYFGKALP